MMIETQILRLAISATHSLQVKDISNFSYSSPIMNNSINMNQDFSVSWYYNISSLKNEFVKYFSLITVVTTHSPLLRYARD